MIINILNNNVDICYFENSFNLNIGIRIDDFIVLGK